MTYTSVFCEAAVQPAAYPGGRRRVDWRLGLLSACTAVLVSLPTLLSAEPQEIIITTCEGKISSEFESLWINAVWKIDWPERVSHIQPHVMTIVRKQICADTFGFLSWKYNEMENEKDKDQDKDKEMRDILCSERLDYAQLDLFRTATEKVAETEESFCARLRELDFQAFLEILFVTDGYIGYRLDGYHNEGGNGCHSNVIVRVLSLTTGNPLRESDFIATKRFPDLYAHIVSKACAESGFTSFDLMPNYKPSDSLFDSASFMIEPEGIRWYLPPYSVFPGGAGVVDTLVTWDDLKPFFTEPGYWNAFRQLLAGAKTITRKK